MVARRRSALSPDSVDRILVGACIAVWLAVIGVGVAATVVLVDMGVGHRRGDGGGSHTPWLLYAVIGVSALIIVGAVPLLLRARRDALDDYVRPSVSPSRSAARPGAARPRVAGPAPGAEAPTQKLRVFGSIADPIDRDPPTYRAPEPSPRRLVGGFVEEAIERLWLRATVLTVGAMGVAMLGVVAATYFMGVAKDIPAWVGLGLAAAVTVATPVIPFLFLRQLRSTTATNHR